VTDFNLAEDGPVLQETLRIARQLRPGDGMLEIRARPMANRQRALLSAMLV